MPNFVHDINVKLCRLSLLYVQKEDGFPVHIAAVLIQTVAEFGLQN